MGSFLFFSGDFEDYAAPLSAPQNAGVKNAPIAVTAALSPNIVLSSPMIIEDPKNAVMSAPNELEQTHLWAVLGSPMILQDRKEAAVWGAPGEIGGEGVINETVTWDVKLDVADPCPLPGLDVEAQVAGIYTVFTGYLFKELPV